MYQKIVWCYVFILTLLDISIKTQLTAQGKSHGVTVHDSLIEGITFQEWGKESGTEGGGGVLPEDALRLSPPALSFGRASLGAAHALTVTLTNTANTTMHLASVAGTTPDFHASFFDSKTLAPQANTSFSVVYLGRREGPVSAHLYIHTSLGVHKYPVSAVGAPSEWGVWPLVGVRVPLNATLEPLLTMHNPTDQTIQVHEVYSSASWVGLRLPEGGSRAARAQWALPPHSTRPLVRLALRHAQHVQHTLTAYIRIKANITGPPLVVCVESRRAPAGEYALPLQLRPGARGARDPPEQFEISVGNSLSSAVPLEATVWGGACDAQPLSPAPPPASDEPPAPPDGATLANGADTHANGGTVSWEGARVSLARPAVDALHEPTPTAQLTLDYEKLWAGWGGGGGGEEAWCAGWVRVGRAALPYSVRLLPGTLRLAPNPIDFITESETAVKEMEVRAHNEFPVPMHIVGVEYGPDIDKYFETEQFAPLVVASGAAASVARLRLRMDAPSAPFVSALTVRTNLTHYTLPVRLYTGTLQLEWEWPGSTRDLDLGVVGASSTRRVSLALHNRGPAPLCIQDLSTDLPGATIALDAHTHVHTPHCVHAGDTAKAWLTAVAPARAGAAAGRVRVRTQHARSAAAVSLRADLGHVRARDLPLADAAPYAWSWSPLVVESTMSLRMRLVNVTRDRDDPALTFVADEGDAEIERGVTALGSVVYAMEALCAPHCYTGLDLDMPEGAAWVVRGESADEASLRADAELARARHALYAQRAAHLVNVSLHVHTTQVVQIPVRGCVRARWPRLCSAGAGRAGLAPVGGALELRVLARNPSASHALVLQPAIGDRLPLPALAGGAESPACKNEECEWAVDAFKLTEWRTTKGEAARWEGGGSGDAGAGGGRWLPPILLQPAAEVELHVTFAPKRAAPLTAYLYLRNNLTILEGVQLSGRGAHPSFELAGRKPGSNSPLLFEVSECSDGVGTVRRSLVARNTGRVPVRLREWRVAGAPCHARGFRLSPCAPLALAPNHSRAIHLAFTADFTLARVDAVLQLRTDLGIAEFTLAGAAPARLLPACAASAPRPPWEPALRAAGTLLALAAAALVLAAAALDAERLLRRARSARAAGPLRAPLDLRGVAHEPTVPPPRAPPPRRRRSSRRPLPPLDPQAERRAFERWRAEVLRRDSNRAEDESSRSSEDADVQLPTIDSSDPPELDVRDDNEPPETPVPPDEYETEADTEEQPRTSGDEDNASTGTDSSSPQDEPEEHETQPLLPVETEVEQSTDVDVRSDTAATDVRSFRPRRETETPRRADKPRATDSDALSSRRTSANKHHARKEKGLKRRERPLPTPTRNSPPQTEVRSTGNGSGGVRWGTSFSSVVARSSGANTCGSAAGEGRLAPIGSQVSRGGAEACARAPPPNNSLFFYNDATHAHAAATWCPPAPDRVTFAPPQRDYHVVEDQPRVPGYGSIGSGSVWGVAGGWPWGGGYAPAIRPPPGFSARAPLRTFDPFHSPLASIWAPADHDWRRSDREENNNN